ncbi:MAG: hypothetical protein JWM28_3918 [Chitinophagaceae bacterium]|nr:hypothetical protein [Chitinophagaceae bacterium]
MLILGFTAIFKRNITASGHDLINFQNKTIP